MSDPRRLIDDPNLSALGRAVLASSDDDGPSSEHRSAIGRKLGIGAGLATIVSSEASAIGTALWWKLAVVFLVAGGITVGVLSQTGGTEPPRVTVPSPPPAIVAPSLPVPDRVAPLPPPVEVPVAPAPPSAPPPPPARPLPRVATPPAAAPVPEPAEVAPPAVAPEVAPPETTPLAPPIDARRLAAEVALIDRARAAVTAHDIPGALALLDEYRTGFADGALVAEAEVVRIEALFAGHRTQEATDAGNAFLVRFPHSPLVRRVRSLISSPAK